VIELCKQFVVATDEVWRLQTQKDPECVFFQEMSKHGHYGHIPGKTRQGIYVCSASGEFLGSINSNNAGHVLQMMQQSLARWDRLPAEKRQLESQNKIRHQHRWEDSYPENGLVLNMITRDLPESCDPDQPCEVKWNQDFVWFSKSEARSWLPGQITLGATGQVPQKLVARLARVHIVDTVKGQTIPFENNELYDSKISTEIVSVTDNLVQIKITGQTNAASEKTNRRQTQRGITTRLLGNATYDLNQSKFTKFEFVALGARWGQTQFNFRNRDGTNNTLGFVFRMVSENSPKVAPAFIYDYHAEWVKRP
jgi:hypothetical protein